MSENELILAKNSAMKYNIRNLISAICITVNDGQKVYDLIHPDLVASHPVELDFAGVKIIAAPFLNKAIGQLYQDIQPEDLKRLLTVYNLNSVGMKLLDIVMENSRRYYGDREYRKAVEAVIMEQAANI